MKVEQIYFRWCAAILSLVIIWGIIAPMLVSSQADIGVFLGVVLFLFAPVLGYWIVRPIYKNKLNKEK